MTKKELEARVEELETKVRHYLNMLDEENQKYYELMEQKSFEFYKLPEYQQMKREIEQLKEEKRLHESIIERNKETEMKLRNKIQELLADNKQLKDTGKDDNISDDSPRNERGAGRKPKSEDIIRQQINQIESYLAEGKKAKDITSLMNISERTYYRLKKLVKGKSKD